MLRIGVTHTDWESLRCWGREAVNTQKVDHAARLLLAVLLDIEGDPPRYADCPKPKRNRPQGSAFYNDHIHITQTTDSAGTRALWMWGYERGCANIAQSFRLLMTKVVAAYPDLSPEPPEGGHRIECLHELATLIEEKSHLVSHAS